MDFNEVENFSESQIMELYNDVAETGNIFVAANSCYDNCYGIFGPGSMTPYCDSADNHKKWMEGCMKCCDNNNNGIYSDNGECYLYGKLHDEGLWPGGTCPSYDGGGIK